jgi:hypothetical protein
VVFGSDQSTFFALDIGQLEVIGAAVGIIGLNQEREINFVIVPIQALEALIDPAFFLA